MHPRARRRHGRPGGGQPTYRRPIALGAIAAGAAVTVATWFVAVRIIDDLEDSVSALALQAATGLLAVVVLLVVMNWFFHKVYWTGWISMHTERKRRLLSDTESSAGSPRGWRQDWPCWASPRCTARAWKWCCSSRATGFGSAMAASCRACWPGWR